MRTPISMRTLLLGGMTVAVMALTVVLAAVYQAPSPGKVELVQLNADNWNRFVPEGKEVDAIYGDYLLRNAHLTAVIAQPLATRHANMTTRDVGGCLIDLTVNDAPSDQLAAFYPARKVPYRKVELAASASAGSGEAAALTVRTEPAAGQPVVSTTYRLGKHDRWLTVETSFSNPHGEPLTISLGDDFRADGGKEDMVRSPNSTTDYFWLHDRYWGQAYGLDAQGRKLQLNSDARTTQIAYVDERGDARLTLAPGQTVVLTRRIYPGRNVWDVHALAASSPESLVPVRLLVRDGRRQPLPDVRVELFRGNEAYGAAMMPKDGVLATRLPPGDYRARCTLYGNPLGGDRPLTVSKDREQIELRIEEYNYGTLTAAITDADGQPIPCKVELKPKADGVRLDFGPETAEFAVRNLRYTPDGRFTQTLPPGRYDVVVSHGPEFDALFLEVEVPAHGTATLTGKLVRTVDTTGWVSSDFHSHASPSGDNTSSQLGRVLNLVCEHIEFAPCTEHNRVSTYQPHIERLGIGKFISSVEGIELTGSPLPLNHQNAFPMRYTPHVQDGGGPTTAGNLEDQIERLALWDDRSEKLLQVNHPDVGWMFYDKDGDGKPDAGHERAFPFMDVMEIHPVEHALDLKPTVTLAGNRQYHNTVFRWLQLLNQGFRIYGVVNTDAHYNFHGSGALRNWIQSPTDDPREIRYMDMVHAAEQGRLVMSNGPFLEVWAREVGQTKQVTAGEDLSAPTGRVALHVRVQCPNWFDVDRVQVLVNGRARPEWTFTREKHPDAFRSTVVKFDRTLELSLERDAHLVVITGHPGLNLARVFGPVEGNMPPAAISNPIFVDVDGQGFQPNRDTLDTPLPVKFGVGG